jgi:hypothetical protein
MSKSDGAALAPGRVAEIKIFASPDLPLKNGRF